METQKICRLWILLAGVTELALTQIQCTLCCPEGFSALSSEMWVGGVGAHHYLKGSYKDGGAKKFLVVPDSVVKSHGSSLDIRKNFFSKRVVQCRNKGPKVSHR